VPDLPGQDFWYYHYFSGNTGETMATTLTVKGQVTIPKQIRDSLDLQPGTQLEFTVNGDGEVVLQRADKTRQRKPDRFEAARGKADVKWRTRELMALLRDG
jgi:AbrB family looped-hinge helix DNA binding protein